MISYRNVLALDCFRFVATKLAIDTSNFVSALDSQQSLTSVLGSIELIIDSLPEGRDDR